MEKPALEDLETCEENMEIADNVEKLQAKCLRALCLLVEHLESVEDTDSEWEEETGSEWEEVTGSESEEENEDKKEILHNGRSFVVEVDEHSASFAIDTKVSADGSSHVYNEDEQANQNSAKPHYPNGSITDSDADVKRELGNGAPVTSATSSYNPTVVEFKEYRELFMLYSANVRELNQLKEEEFNYKRETDDKIKTLTLKLDLMESDKNILEYNLLASQNLISDFEQEKNKLSGEVMALKSQLSSMSKAKDDIQCRLESSEITIQSLEKKLNELSRDDVLSQLHALDKRLLYMQLCYDRNVLNYNKSIEELKSELKLKIKKAEDLALKNSELQQKCQQLQLEKGEFINKMSEDLEVSQKKCHEFLESGIIKEFNHLKLQVQHLKEEKSNIECGHSLTKNLHEFEEGFENTVSSIKRLLATVDESVE